MIVWVSSFLYCVSGTNPSGLLLESLYECHLFSTMCQEQTQVGFYSNDCMSVIFSLLCVRNKPKWASTLMIVWVSSFLYCVSGTNPSGLLLESLYECHLFSTVCQEQTQMDFYSNDCMSVIFSLLCVRNKSTNWRRTMRRPLTYYSDSWMHRRWITSDCSGRSSTCRDPQRQSLRIFHHLTSFSQFHHIRLRRDKKEKYVLFFLIHCPFFSFVPTYW